MASVKTLVTIKRGGVYHPPGSILRGLTDHEAAALSGYAVRHDEPEPVPAPAVEPVVEPLDGLPVALTTEPENPVERIVSAIDLLAPDDFKQDGTPKLAPLSAVLGFKPSPEEVAVAVKLKETL